jgi:hypothetical protein
MEINTQFDLNQAIQYWRENLGESPAFRRESLDELESHLRDSVSALHARGLTDEESFMVSTKRMGNSDLLQKEFSKVNRKSVWIDRTLWMLIGIQLWALVRGAASILSRNGLSFGFNYRALPHDFGVREVALPAVIFAIIQLAGTVALLALCWWLIKHRGHRLAEWMSLRLNRRSSLIATCAAFVFASLMAIALSGLANVLPFKLLNQPSLIVTTIYFGWGQVLVYAVQTVAMAITTLLLARQRIRLNFK